MGEVIKLGKAMEKEYRKRQTAAEVRAEMFLMFAEAIDLDTGLPVGEERARQLVDDFCKTLDEELGSYGCRLSLPRKKKTEIITLPRRGGKRR